MVQENKISENRHSRSLEYCQCLPSPVNQTTTIFKRLSKMFLSQDSLIFLVGYIAKHYIIMNKSNMANTWKFTNACELCFSPYLKVIALGTESISMILVLLKLFLILMAATTPDGLRLLSHWLQQGGVTWPPTPRNRQKQHPPGWDCSSPSCTVDLGLPVLLRGYERAGAMPSQAQL